MKIFSLIKRSTNHPNFTEDFLFSFKLTDEISVYAVMDGCSSAKDSHFASALYSKSFEKSCKMLPQMKEIIEDFDIEGMEPEAIAEFVLNQLYDDLRKLKRLLFLKTEELLSTLVLLVYNSKTNIASIHVSGDGLFAINGEVTEIDQFNVPNFLAYHLNKKFEIILENEIQKWNFNEVSDVTISTDGIDKFRKNIKSESEVKKLREHFLAAKPKKSKEDYLESQYKYFTKKGFVPYDDIGIIRIVNDSN